MQGLLELAKQIRFDGEEMEVWDLFFRGAQTRKACQLFLNWLKANGQDATRREVSQFGRDLEKGRIKLGFSYNRASFYKTVLRRLVNLGLIGIRGYFLKGHIQERYSPIIQPIPSRSPSRRNLWHTAWLICRKWNDFWSS